MRWLLPLYIAVLSSANILNGSQTKSVATTGDLADMHTQKIVFATYAKDDEAFRWILVMVESLRAFGGNLHDAPVRVYLPDDQPEMEKAIVRKPIPTGVSFGRSNTPTEANRSSLPERFSRRRWLKLKPSASTSCSPGLIRMSFSSRNHGSSCCLIASVLAIGRLCTS